MKQLTIEAETGNLCTVQNFIRSELEAVGCPKDTIFEIDFAVSEIFCNIAKYAYCNAQHEDHRELSEPQNANTCNVRISIDVNDEVVIVFEDKGIPFNPLEREDPDINTGLEKRKVGGLGIYASKRMLDNKLRYSYEEGKNILTIRAQIENRQEMRCNDE